MIFELHLFTRIKYKLSKELMIEIAKNFGGKLPKQRLFFSPAVNWAQFHVYAYRQILRFITITILCLQVPNFCASCVSEECLRGVCTHTHKQKVPGYT